MISTNQFAKGIASILKTVQKRFEQPNYKQTLAMICPRGCYGHVDTITRPRLICLMVWLVVS